MTGLRPGNSQPCGSITPRGGALPATRRAASRAAAATAWRGDPCPARRGSACADVGHLERHDLAAPRHRPCRGSPCTSDQVPLRAAARLPPRSHHRQLARLVDDSETAREVGPVDRHEKKKRSVETELLMPACVWCSWKRRRSSAAAVSGERAMKAANAFTQRDVVTARVLGEAAHAHVFMRSRSALPHDAKDRWSSDAPLELKVDPSCSEADHRPMRQHQTVFVDRNVE